MLVRVQTLKCRLNQWVTTQSCRTLLIPIPTSVFPFINPPWLPRGADFTIVIINFLSLDHRGVTVFRSKKKPPKRVFSLTVNNNSSYLNKKTPELQGLMLVCVHSSPHSSKFHHKKKCLSISLCFYDNLSIRRTL